MRARVKARHMTVLNLTAPALTRPSGPQWNNARSIALESLSMPPLYGWWACEDPEPACLSDPNLGVWWPWPAPHPFLILRATSVPFPRTPKWLVILKHHLGAPFVFSGEVSEGLSLGLNLIPHFHINCSVYGRSERTVNNEHVMLNVKLNLGTDMLLYESFCSQSIVSW